MADFKYKVYYNNSLCKIYNNNYKYILNMIKRDTGQNPSIADGGQILLPNGDILIINEKMGGLDPWGSGQIEYYGVGLSLDSGNEFIVYYKMPSLEREQEIGYGVIYEYNEEDLYSIGNFFNIYLLDGASIYDYQEGFWHEEYLQQLTHYTIKINENEEWELVENDPLFTGNTVELNSGEEIYVSPLGYADGPSIWFTRSSGDGCYAFLKYDGDSVNETVNFWLGTWGSLDDNYTLTIYDFGDDDYESAVDYSQDYSEENVSEYLDMLCILRYNASTNEWYVDEDYS